MLVWLHQVLATAKDQSDIEEWKALLRRVDGLLSNLKYAYNYFGHEPDYVPRLSLAEMQKRLDASLASLKALEATHTAYFLALKEATVQQAHLTNAAALVDAQRSHYQDELQRVRSDIAVSLDAIAAAERLVDHAKIALGDAIKDYTKAVKESFNLDPQQLIGILETLSFAPVEPGPQQAAMLASQASKLLSGCLDTFNTELGGYKKEYIIHQFDVFGEDVKTLENGYKVRKDGGIALADPNAYKLLMKKGRLRPDVQSVLWQGRRRRHADEAGHEQPD